MHHAESTDQQIERILVSFASGESQRLAATLQDLLVLETTYWLIERHDAAIFCVELQRLAAHQLASEQADGLALFESGLHRLPDLGNAVPESDLTELVNDMRASRGASRFDRARTLLDIEGAIWREMHRRSNVPRRLRRHLATVIDLIAAMQYPPKFEAALKLLGREAEALKGLFRFNPSSLVWAWLFELTRCAQGHLQALKLDGLVRYCQALRSASGEPRSLKDASAALREIATELARIDSAHPLAMLLAAPPETLAAKTPEPPPEPDASPFEARALSEALQNLEDQISAEVLETSSMSQSLVTLAKEVLNSHGEGDERLAHFSPEFMQLAELIDLVASGVMPREGEVDELASRLEAYVSTPRSLQQVDEALLVLQKFRAQLLSGAKTSLDADLGALASVTKRMGLNERESADSLTRLFGFLMTRGELHYAMRQTEEMRIEPWASNSSALPVDALFPQGGPLAAPRQVLAFECDGRHLNLACDHIQGPMWIEFEHPMPSDRGFAMRIEGGGVCVIAPELVRSHCQ